ncbi:FKBP-type peptidyl-prolyl cis-trans isomerase [Vibrio hippocampi]|uniref:Peptidyl-prolyl cis-trans isomerase n=1 Tax=Vibrio hippocampi TaxID=654686 RepID=A0ABM8ZM13_9VIBR|nr:FKBP-type peptidyl-prolyl cis-trans isomerase [Vibrio hippocampi]CAH0529572.1 hypothetical protein VHP8226_03327 [Vibrio hippocampi]
MNKFILPLIALVLAAFMIYRTWNNHKASEQNFAIGQTFLAENGQKEGVITTESGLQYLVLHKAEPSDEHKKPQSESKITVHYEGKLIDGTVFDSSIERGAPISFALNQVIKGWQEGMLLMSVGDKYRLFVPSTLGYGTKGTGPIPPSSVLIFDVELIDVQ